MLFVAVDAGLMLELRTFSLKHSLLFLRVNPNRKCFCSRQEQCTMEDIVRDHRALRMEPEQVSAKEHVLVLIFSSCVIPSSKRINHNCV